MRPDILIVDDDPRMRRTLVRMLHAHASIVDVSSCEQALGLIITGDRFTAILCDLTLPGLSGVDFFRRLRVLVPDQAERFVALTGSLIETLDADFIRAVAGRLLFKPIETERLMAVVLGVAERGRAAESEAERRNPKG